MLGSGNIARRLRESAAAVPHQQAIVASTGQDNQGRTSYSHLTFKQLDQESDKIAHSLREWGVVPGTRLVLMVPPSIEFIALTFGLFKAGAVIVLIDPGMGRTNIIRCLADVDPQGFVAIPVVHRIVQAMTAMNFVRRGLLRRERGSTFPNAKFNVSVGGRSTQKRKSYADLIQRPWVPFDDSSTKATEPAAIIFTSGSTGPPKGVLYEHGMFDAQVDFLRDHYQVEPGEKDLPGFPLFGLFNAAMSVTTIVPDMDPTRPADVDPVKIIRAIRDHGVTQAFGSPAMWNTIGRYCEKHDIKLPTLRRILSAGAPVPQHVIQRMRKTFVYPGADIFTPYGATESLPVSSISGREVIESTSQKTIQGAGTCVGLPFPGVDVKVIEIEQAPINDISDVKEMPAGKIGEIIVRSPSATREYFLNPTATKLAKVPDGDRFWHRMGDVGYFDETGRLWFCGRKAHIVETPEGRMFTVRCEAIFNQHEKIYRSALVGIGDAPNQTPVIVVEPEKNCFPQAEAAISQLKEELLKLGTSSDLTASIKQVLFHPSLPVDIRHNVKIFREKLAPWAAQQLKQR